MRLVQLRDEWVNPEKVRNVERAVVSKNNQWVHTNESCYIHFDDGYKMWVFMGLNDVINVLQEEG